MIVVWLLSPLQIGEELYNSTHSNVTFVYYDIHKSLGLWFLKILI